MMKQLLTFAFLLFGLMAVSFGQSSGQSNKLLLNDFESIFQLAIDYPDLQQYYHIDTDTSRRQVTFQFLGNVKYDNLTGVTKFGRQVVVLTESEIKRREIKSYFVINDYVCRTNSVRIQLEYPIEGLLVSCSFKRQIING